MQDTTAQEFANLNKKIDEMNRRLDFYFGKYFTTKANDEQKAFFDSMNAEEIIMFSKARENMRKQDYLRTGFKNFGE